MRHKDRSATFRFLIGAIALGAARVSQAQIVQFPGGTAPVITAASVKQSDAMGRPAVLSDVKTGGQFVPSYDAEGRLISLLSAKGRNAFDLRAVTYSPDGRLSFVSFGNRYELFFRYRADGTQEVADPLGGSILRVESSRGQFEDKSVQDPSGYLVPSLQRLESLFLLFGSAPGLSASPISAAP